MAIFVMVTKQWKKMGHFGMNGQTDHSPEGFLHREAQNWDMYSLSKQPLFTPRLKKYYQRAS